MSNKELPANEYLGYGLDMCTLTPTDIKGVSSSIKNALRIVGIDLDTTRSVEIGGQNYSVSKHIGISTDVSSLSGDLITFKSGTEASNALKADASLSGKYMAVTGSASVNYAVEKSFSASSQFALYSFNFVHYITRLKDYAGLLNDEVLERRVKDLPPFTSDPNVVQEYKDFFSMYGTHVITSVEYGARFQLTAYASTKASGVNENFGASVAAAFEGVTNGGKFDASIKTESHYKSFENSLQKQVSVKGGDVNIGADIMINPASFKRFTDWRETASKNPDVMGMSTIELWSLLRNSGNKVVKEAARNVHDAYFYIVTHPQLYETEVTFNIESDWAEFGLLTPSAVIRLKDGEKTPEATVVNDWKIIWGKEGSHKQYRMTINFRVINDGSPIDFYISHGSDGGSGAKGLAKIGIKVDGQTTIWCENTKITDNVWNTEWFYQKNVSAKPIQMDRTDSQTLAAHDAVEYKVAEEQNSPRDSEVEEHPYYKLLNEYLDRIDAV